MRLITTFAICAFAAGAMIGPALAPALAASSDYFLKLGPIKGEGSAARKGHQDPIEILSYSFGATRKGWDGTIKGSSVAESSGTAKFGAVAGAHRDDTIANPAGKVSIQDISAPSMTSGPAKSTPLTSGRVAAPLAAGSVTVGGRFPGCTVGTQYAGAVLQVPGARYVLTDVQITSCPAARSSMAGEYLRESLSLNYKKVTVRGWNPEKKEE